MTPLTLSRIEQAVRASWSARTCSPDDLARSGWSPDNPAWGQCDVTALVINDLLGGDFVVGEVYLGDEQHGFHTWNRLPSGLEIDLTREQFRDGQAITGARVVQRPPGRLPRRHEDYQFLRNRVFAHLDPGRGTSAAPDVGP